MSEYQAETDAGRAIDNLERRILDMENIVAQWQINGADSLFGQSGGHIFGGGISRLDQTGMQFVTKAGSAKDIAWVDSAFSVDPSNDHRAAITGQATGGTSVLRLSAYHSSQPSTVTGVQINGLGPTSNSVQFVNVFFRPDSWTTRSISGGVVTLTPGALFTVQAQSGTADDLDTVQNTVPAALEQGVVLWFKASAGETITVKHGTGNIYTADGSDITLTGTMIAQFVVANASGHIYEVGRGGGSGSTGGGMQLLVVKEANTARTATTTTTVDPHLVAPIGANENWVYEFHFVVTGGATPDFKYQIAVPAGAVGSVMMKSWAAAAFVHAASNVNTDTAMVSASWPRLVTIQVGVDNGATAGNVALHWAQNTSDAANVTVLAGGYILGMQQA